MKRNVLVVLVLVALGFILLALNIPSTKILHADVIILDSDLLGFNADGDALHFGSVPRGNIGERKVVFWNENKFPQIIHLGARGEVAGWLIFPENNFVLMPNTTKEVIVRLAVPKIAGTGKYQADVIVAARRKWF